MKVSLIILFTFLFLQNQAQLCDELTYLREEQFKEDYTINTKKFDELLKTLQRDKGVSTTYGQVSNFPKYAPFGTSKTNQKKEKEDLSCYLAYSITGALFGLIIGSQDDKSGTSGYIAGGFFIGLIIGGVRCKN
jgi:hypothetical protein